MATKVLIVEDEPLVQRMYDRALSMAGLDVRLAKDGTIVFETILLNRPDIIILDVMMPNFNGLETLKELKKDRKTWSIPVIMLSANDNPEVIQQALSLGAERYLVKQNVEPQDIVNYINQAVEHKEGKQA